MNSLDEICEDIKSLIESFNNKFSYQFNNYDNRHRIKHDVEKILYQSGYSCNDITVEVSTNLDNSSEVHIILIPLSEKGIMLLEALKNGSLN